MDWATCWAIFSQTHLVTLGRNVHVQSKLIKWAKQTVFEARVLTHLHVILLQQKCSEEKFWKIFRQHGLQLTCLAQFLLHCFQQISPNSLHGNSGRNVAGKVLTYQAELPMLNPLLF
jgi:hypothetical protein